MALVLGPAANAAGPAARVAIIIDDLGNRLDLGRRAVALPGPVTLSFLPHTPHAQRLAERAHGSGKEIMLHLPMEAVDSRPLGPGGLTLEMSRNAFLQTVEEGLAAVPHVRGVNNHMGSLLTRQAVRMDWLMIAMNRFGPLYFVDSRTTAETVALQVADEHEIPHRKRDVFLDNDRNPALVRRQIEKLIRLARRDGTAVGIGHPYPETLTVLEQVLPQFGPGHGVRLVPVSKLLKKPQDRSPELWHASLSPSPRDVKNSKPSPSSTCCDAPASRW